MSTGYKLPEEWFKQADYDLGTAKAMLRTRRYIYTVFMCHLTIEKALKGIYAKKLRKNPSNYQTKELLQWLKKMDL